MRLPSLGGCANGPVSVGTGPAGDSGPRPLLGTLSWDVEELALFLPKELVLAGGTMQVASSAALPQALKATPASGAAKFSSSRARLASAGPKPCDPARRPTAYTT